MFCTTCGTQLPSQAAFCTNCGNAIVNNQINVPYTVGTSTPQALAIPMIVEDAPAVEQVAFYRKTYLTAGVAFLAWVVTLFTLFNTGIAESILSAMGEVSWLLVLGLFWVVTYLGEKLAFNEERGLQVLGLGIGIVAYAIIFVPLIALVMEFSNGWYGAINDVLMPAFIATLTIFAALTMSVFLTNTNFSFLKNFVVFGSFAALGAIIILSVYGMGVESWFAVAMMVLMSATILWQTWKIKEDFDTTQHVGAASMIFASFLILLWYVICLIWDFWD